MVGLVEKSQTQTSNVATVHRKVSPINLPCKYCEYTSTQEPSLKRHMIAEHGDSGHPCDICDFAWASATDLNAHKKSPHGDDEIPEF